MISASSTLPRGNSVAVTVWQTAIWMSSGHVVSNRSQASPGGDAEGVSAGVTCPRACCTAVRMNVEAVTPRWWATWGRVLSLPMLLLRAGARYQSRWSPRSQSVMPSASPRCTSPANASPKPGKNRLHISRPCSLNSSASRRRDGGGPWFVAGSSWPCRRSAGMMSMQNQMSMMSVPLTPALGDRATSAHTND
jgi:hypothetical protein